MGNSLRCCLACVLPCGALDLIRIVHLNGSVDELTGPVTAGEVLKSHPNHVLTTPTASGRILILSPPSHLKRGAIYFLIPAASLPHDNTTVNKFLSTNNKYFPATAKKTTPPPPAPQAAVGEVIHEKLQPGKAPLVHRRRLSRSRSTAGVLWRPVLESISED